MTSRYGSPTAEALAASVTAPARAAPAAAASGSSGDRAGALSWFVSPRVAGTPRAELIDRRDAAGESQRDELVHAEHHDGHDHAGYQCDGHGRCGGLELRFVVVEVIDVRF